MRSTQDAQSWLSRFVRFAGSLRVAVTLLGLLIVTAAIGGVIPQSPNTPNAELIYLSYGAFAQRVIHWLSLNDVFHSAWFYVLLGMFSLNLGLCTGKRLRGSLWILLHGDDDSGVSPTYRMNRVITLPAQEEGRCRKLVGVVLRREGFTAHWHSWGVNAERNRWGIFGPDLVHLSLLIVLMGGVLGLVGRQGMVFVESDGPRRLDPCVTSQEAGPCLADVDFSLRIDDFGADWASEAEETPKQYWTDVTVLRSDIPAKTDRIEVNHPFTYHGVSFFQSAYGLDPSRATIRLRMTDEFQGAHAVPLAVGDEFALPGAGLQIRLVRFFANLAWRPGGPIDQLGLRARHPAALFELTSSEDEAGTLLTSLLVYPSTSTATGQLPGWSFSIEDYVVPTYVGIRYVVSPGYPVVWSGLILLVIGLVVSFFFRRTCLALRWDRESTSLVLGSPGNQPDRVHLTVEHIARRLEQEVSRPDDS